jgi:hypothetical protein
MGSYIELNDTLQITTRQGFPKELNIKKHLKKPFKASDFKGKVFEFKNKPNVRIYHSPPVRVFYAHNINGKWLYWGLVEIIEETLDLVKKTTSGKYQIIKIFSPDEMKNIEQLIHTFKDSRFFENNPDL